MIKNGLILLTLILISSCTAPEIRDYFACEVSDGMCACADFRINEDFIGRISPWELYDIKVCSEGRVFPRLDNPDQDQWVQFSSDLEEFREWLLDQG